MFHNAQASFLQNMIISSPKCQYFYFWQGSVGWVLHLLFYWWIKERFWGCTSLEYEAVGGIGGIVSWLHWPGDTRLLVLECLCALHRSIWRTLPCETVSSCDKPVVTNQGGSTSVDIILLKACLPGPFSFLSVLASYYFDAWGSNCASSTACSKESSSVLIMLMPVSCCSK